MELIIDNIVYKIDAFKNRAVVYRVKNTAEHIVIPDILKNKYIVKEIGSHAFCENRNIKSIVLPSNLALIGEYAFKGCINLEEVKLLCPQSKIIIFKKAFCQCYNLKNFSVFGEINIHEEGIFMDCYNLQNLACSISGKIRNSTFYRCNNLSSLIFDDVHFLPKVFDKCSKLNKITIRKNLNAAKSTLKKMMDFEIHCPSNSTLTELAYVGHKIIIYE